MKHLKSTSSFVLILLILITQLIIPISVRADGDTTPVPTESTEVVTTPEPVDTATVEIAPPTEVINVTATPEPVESPAVTDTPIPPTQPPEETLTATAEPTQATSHSDVTPEPTTEEILQSIPSDTNVVVLDENGQNLPLATNDAQEIVASSDPMWCPAGETPGGPGCTPSYTTVTDLINDYYGGLWMRSGPGTIYFTSVPVYSNNDVIFDQSDPNLAGLTDLTIQGGWNGYTGTAYGINGSTTFTVPIIVTNWNGAVTIRNVIVDGATGVGIGVDNGQADVNIDNVIVKNTNPGSSYHPSMVFGDGIDVFSKGGTVSIHKSQFINNNKDYGGYGAWISADTTGDIVVSDSVFDNNSIGMEAHSFNNAYILGGNQFINNDVGITFYDCSGNLILDPSIIFDNVQDLSNWGDCPEPISATPVATVVPTVIPTIVPETGRYVLTLDCSIENPPAVPLPNGDLVEIFCPVKGEAEIARRDNTTLPDSLPDGYTYASAFDVGIKNKDEITHYINRGGYIKSSFVDQPLQEGSSYTILYWDELIFKDGKFIPNPDGGKWVPLKDFMLDAQGEPQSFPLNPENPTDPRKILSGVRLVDNHVTVSTDFPGIFVLAQY